jgi:hypothetical protein
MPGADLLFLVSPLVIIGATSGLLYLYMRGRLLNGAVLSYSLLAYVLAIGGKVAVQALVPVPADPWAAGVYYGAQTCLLEVGLAYLFARQAIDQGRIRVDQAPAYGVSLAFWENGVLLGVLALPGLWLAIDLGGAGLPSGSVETIAGLVVLGTLERVSSILAHFSWGLLVVAAAASRRSRYLLLALPMGLIDFLVPFASTISLAEFEGIVFALSALCLGVAYLATRGTWPRFWELPPAVRPSEGGYYVMPSTYRPVRPPGAPPVGAERAQCPSCRVVFPAPWNPLRPHLGSRVLRKCPSCGRWSFLGPYQAPAPDTPDVDGRRP